MYEEAEKNAKTMGESGRARRFNRAIKTLKDLMKQAQSGRAINNDDIPPEVSTGPRKPASENNNESSAAAAAPNRPAPSIPEVPQPDYESSTVVPTSPQKVEDQNEVEEEVKPPHEPTVNTELVSMLNDRRNQFKMAALTAKKSGDNANAVKYIKITKQFEKVIAAAESGQPVDLSLMPDPPVDSSQNSSTDSSNRGTRIEENQMQTDGLVGYFFLYF